MQECASCDNVVTYRDAFQRDAFLWVVMELCDMGSTLNMMQRRQCPLGESDIAWICRGVLSALDYMHTIRKAIHRDIKAANVLVTRDGVVKLADFGVVAQLCDTS